MNQRLDQATQAGERAILAAIRARTSPANDALLRAAHAALVAAARRGTTAEAVARELHGDPETMMLTRAAVEPASLTSDEWGAVLSGTAVASFVNALAPVSAAAALLALGLRVDVGPNGSVRVPGTLAAADAARFTGEGAPISVTRAALAGPVLRPAKVAGLVVLSREAAKTTAAEPIVRDLLSRSASLALDVAVLGSGAAEAGVRPAGLFHGVAPLPATQGGGSDALILPCLGGHGISSPSARPVRG